MNTLNFSDTGTVTVFVANDHVLLFPNGLREARETALLTLTDVPTAGDTCTIDTTVYTFRAALSVPPIANEVLIGADEQDSANNLRYAIMGEASQQGIKYSLLTQEHATAIAPYPATFAAGTATLRIYTRADVSVSIATTETFTSGTNVWDVADTTPSQEVWIGGCYIDHITVGSFEDQPILIWIFDAIVDASGRPILGGTAASLDRYKMTTGVANTGTKGPSSGVSAVQHFDPYSAKANDAAITTAFGGLAGMRLAWGPQRLNELAAAAVGKPITVPVCLSLAAAVVGVTFTGAYTPSATNRLDIGVHYEPRTSGGARRRSIRSQHVEALI